ncbi:MAG: hypothetical protein LCH61_00970 [Proteobacteria bacterium]|nr:hypothetical protein [Pseudomonadota bacterium]
MWTKRLTIIGGERLANDWTVYRNGQPVGRVCRMHSNVPDSQITWSSWVPPYERGIVADEGAGLEALRSSIRARWPDGPGMLPKDGPG